MPPRARVERTERVMVRLSDGGPPDEVLFSTAEFQAVERAARACTPVGGRVIVSAFVRDVGLAAAKAAVQTAQSWDNYQTCKAAANACNMPLGQWLRDVTLAGVGGSPAMGCMEAARVFVTRMEKAAE